MIVWFNKNNLILLRIVPQMVVFFGKFTQPDFLFSVSLVVDW